MLLCDPRTQVIIRRTLSEATARLWYPGNDAVVQVNKDLAALNKSEDPTQYAARVMGISASVANYEGTRMTSKQLAGDMFTRKTTFTPPRTITLDTKYEGAVAISVWTGYAVLVIDKTGHRKVVVGPETFLLEYDETLAILELSTGTPKIDSAPFKTVYLRVANNRVSDRITVETKDLVKIDISLSYRVNFEGEDHEKWFAVENYVRLLTDHTRSLIRNVAKRTNVAEFYANTIDIVRDNILGSGAPNTVRPGKLFNENGMRIYDVEVLDVRITSADVAALLLDQQTFAIRSTLQLAKGERELEVTKKLQELSRETAKEVQQSNLQVVRLKGELLSANEEVKQQEFEANAAYNQARLEADLADSALHSKLVEANIRDKEATETLRLELEEKALELHLREVLVETEQIIARTKALDPAMATALTTFSDNALVEKISVALAPMAAMSGVSAADVLSQLFKGTPMAEVMKQLGTRSKVAISQ
jgi:major vault protein